MRAKSRVSCARARRGVRLRAPGRVHTGVTRELLPRVGACSVWGVTGERLGRLVVGVWGCLGWVCARRERGRRTGKRERRVSVDGGRIVGGCVRCRLSAYVGGGVECYLFGVDNIGVLSGAFYTENGDEKRRTVCVPFLSLPHPQIRSPTSATVLGSVPNNRGEN